MVRHARWRRSLTALAMAAVLAVTALAAGCGDDDSSGNAEGGDGAKLTLAAYSTPREVYEKLIPAFQQTPEGQGVTFEQSYGASGEQSRAVEAGLPADIIAFSLAPDVDRLVEPGLVAEDWASGEDDGIISDSVVVFAVRPGNPKNIRTWDDLLRDDVDVLTPNVFTSGGAQWNTAAAYGAQLQQGKTPEQAEEYLAKLYANVSVQDKSAREALATFLSGKGDVLLAYENESIFAKNKGEKLDYVVPEETILIENPIAVTTKAPQAAKDFVAFARTPESQRVFGEAGYRPVDPEVLKEFDYPTPAKLFTIADLGGWSEVRSNLFDREDGVVAEIFQNQGTPIE
jgi:sulfate/thiosulfate transport system substrate-binding protein